MWGRRINWIGKMRAVPAFASEQLRFECSNAQWVRYMSHILKAMNVTVATVPFHAPYILKMLAMPADPIERRALAECRKASNL